MAGLDGVLNKIDPGEPMDKNMYELPPEDLAKVPQVPSSLSEALDYLEKDHQFLLKGDVFTADFLEMWISAKRKEADACDCAPIPTSFSYITTSKRFGIQAKPSGVEECPRRGLFATILWSHRKDILDRGSKVIHVYYHEEREEHEEKRFFCSDFVVHCYPSESSMFTRGFFFAQRARRVWRNNRKEDRPCILYRRRKIPQFDHFCQDLFHHEGRKGHEFGMRPSRRFFFVFFVSFVVKNG